MIHTQEQQQPDSGAVRSLSIFCLEKVCYLSWKGEQAQQQQQHKQLLFFHGETTPTSLSTCESSSLWWCRKHSYVTASSFLCYAAVFYYRARFFSSSLPSITQVETGSNVACALYLPFMLLFIISLQRPLNFFQSWRNEPSDNQLSRCDRLLYLFPSKARQCIFTTTKKRIRKLL